MRGIGDRWLAGESVEGVAFIQHERVVITSGGRAGDEGTVALLVSVAPEPTFLVALGAGGDVRVRQSELRRAT
jgi:hypothetical protein